MLDVAAVVRTFLESGYTTIIGAGTTQPLDDLQAKAAIDKGYIPGPRIIPSGPMIGEVGGLGSDGGLMEVVDGAEQLHNAPNGGAARSIMCLANFSSVGCRTRPARFTRYCCRQPRSSSS